MFSMNNDFRSMYSQKANKYNLLIDVHFNEVWDDLIAKLNLSQMKDVLDLGCGTGETLYKIARKFKATKLNITGVDFCPEMIAESKSKIIGDTEAASHQINLYCQDCIAYLKNNQEKKYDLVIASFILAFVEAPDLFDLINKVLKKGSRLVILTTSRDFFREFEKFLFSFMLSHPFYFNWWDFFTKKISHLPPIEKIVHILFKNEFKKLEIERSIVQIPFADPLSCLKWMDESTFATAYFNLIKKGKKDVVMKEILDYIENKSIRFFDQPIKQGRPLRFDWEIYSIIAEK